MAQRFGGKHSPGGARVPRVDARAAPARPLAGKRPARMGARLNLLFLAPVIVAVPAFGRDPVGLALGLAATGVLVLAAWLTREGVRAEDAYNARRIARRPAIPRKLFGSVLTGAGLAIAALSPEGGLLAPILLALLGTVLHAVAFGADPMTDKTEGDIDLFQSDRVARVVDEAENHLSAMQAAIAELGDRALNERVARFAETARAMCRTVEDDPRDLTGVRKYLGVYLLGARDASRKFADFYARGRDAKARSEYEALLDDLEASFAARTDRMLLDDKTDLDVEIDVLRERLERETVHFQ